MKIIDWVNQWITERGSAKILEQRLGLANDKNQLLVTENTELKAKITILEKENEFLKLDNGKLKIESENRKKMGQAMPRMV